MAKQPKNEDDDPLHFDELARALGESEEESVTGGNGEAARDSSESNRGEEPEAPSEDPGSSPPENP